MAKHLRRKNPNKRDIRMGNSSKSRENYQLIYVDDAGKTLEVEIFAFTRHAAHRIFIKNLNKYWPDAVLDGEPELVEVYVYSMHDNLKKQIFINQDLAEKLAGINRQ